MSISSFSPLPRTSISTYSSSNPEPGTCAITVYYQDVDGYLCSERFRLSVHSSEQRCLVMSSGREYRVATDLVGENPHREVNRSMMLFSPNCVIHYQEQKYAFYLDDMGVMILAKLATDSNNVVPLVDTNWVDIKAVSYTRLGAIAADTKGNWLYYQSGREAGIREVWKHNSDGSHKITFHTHYLDNILSGTDIATSISSAGDGSFFYQAQDYSIYERRWLNSDWHSQLVVQAKPDSPNPEYRVAPLTGLASANSDKWKEVHCHYINSANQICVVCRNSDGVEWGLPTVLPSVDITIPGSRLAAYAVDCYFFVAYQHGDHMIKGHFYFPEVTP